MANTLITTIREFVTGLMQSGSSDDFNAAAQLRTTLADLRWPSGTAASQADLMWCDFGRSVASNTNDDLDLTALSALHSPTGAAINFAEIRAILLYWYAANTTTLTIVPGASNGWTALGAALSLTVAADAYVRIFSPKDGAYPVSGSNKVLRLTNSTGATATFDIALIGTSA